MANTKKYVSLDKLTVYDEKIKGVISAGDAAALKSAKEYADSLAVNYDAAGAAASAAAGVQANLDVEIGRAKGEEARIEGLVTTAQGDVDALELVVETKAAQADLEALADKVGEVPTDKTVMGIIGEIQSGNATDNAALQAQIDELSSNKADKEQVAKDIAAAVKVEEEARIAAVAGVQGEVDALEKVHADDKAALEAAIELKADQTALDAVSAVANAAVKQTDYDAKVKALEEKDTEIAGLVATEAERAAGVEADHEERLVKVEAFFEGAAEDGEGLQDALDTLVEIQTYVDTHGEVAAKMVEDIAANAKAIEDHAKVDHDFAAADTALENKLNAEIAKKATIETVNGIDGRLTHKVPGRDDVKADIAMPTHAEAIQSVLDILVDPEKGVISSTDEIAAVGHRVLHGGMEFSASCIVDDACIAAIEKCIPLGPLHNPANLMGIEACEEIFKGVPNVGVFDTQFHQTMPPEAYLYAIPYDYYKTHGIRKYGFHGTSHHFVTNSTAEFLGKDLKDLNIITCHLGNGCSMAAIKNGKVVDTTMGLTPLEGLMMGTRSGDMDPAAVVRMIQLGNTPAEVDTILNKKSGLFGVGGINSGDMRDIIEAAKGGNAQAELALKMFVRRVVKYIGSYYVLVGGAEALVFTGGIGEYSCPIRKMIIEALGCLNIAVDEEKNAACFGKKGVISTDCSAWKAIVMPTNEELMIARSTLQVLGK